MVKFMAFQQSHRQGISVDVSRARREMLWIDRNAVVAGGADAFALWLRAGPGTLACVGRLMQMPIVREGARLVYRLVAANRRSVPGPWDRNCSFIRPET